MRQPRDHDGVVALSDLRPKRLVVHRGLRELVVYAAVAQLFETAASAL